MKSNEKMEPKKRSISFHKDSPDNLHDYLFNGWFDRDVDAKRKHSGMVTGFDKLDEKQPLYPGLYVLGADYGKGKITFLHQMADQIANAGEYVIFFSMLQDRCQMVSRSLSRNMFIRQEKRASNWVVPTVDIYSGKSHPSPSSINMYKMFAKRVYIVEGSFETTVSDIQQYVTDFIQEKGIKPVVFVDHLPTIPSTSGRNLKALKNFQMENNLVLFVITPLNYADYHIPLDLENFENSGDIEHSADCVWGLELAVTRAKIVEDGKEGLKRIIAAEAARDEVRKIRLVCLKNRFGQADYSVDFEYYPKYDYFKCTDLTDYYCEIKRKVVDVIKERKEWLQN